MAAASAFARCEEMPDPCGGGPAHQLWCRVAGGMPRGLASPSSAPPRRFRGERRSRTEAMTGPDRERHGVRHCLDRDQRHGCGERLCAMREDARPVRPRPGAPALVPRCRRHAEGSGISSVRAVSLTSGQRRSRTEAMPDPDRERHGVRHCLDRDQRHGCGERLCAMRGDARPLRPRPGTPALVPRCRRHAEGSGISFVRAISPISEIASIADGGDARPRS